MTAITGEQIAEGAALCEAGAAAGATDFTTPSRDFGAALAWLGKNCFALIQAARERNDMAEFLREHGRSLLLDVDTTGQRDAAPTINARLELRSLLERFAKP